MYTVILVAAFCIFVGASIGWRCERDRFALIIGGGAGAFVGCFVGMMTALALAGFVPTHDEIRGPATLVAMHSSDGTTGTFVWGSGSMNSQVNYNFLYKNSDGSLTPGQVPANSYVHIIEDASLSGVGYWTSTFNVADRTSALASWSLALSDYDHLVRQEFRVPVGTVVQSISIK